MKHWENKSLDLIIEFIEEIGVISEEWKDCIFKTKKNDILDYTGLYKISNFGRIKTLGNGNSNISKKEKILSQNFGAYGYLLINLSKNSVTTTLRVNILVAQSFIPNPENKPQVNHIKGVKSDNRSHMLEWVTPSENGKHAYKLGLSKPNKSQKGKTGYLSVMGKEVNQYELDGTYIRSFGSCTEAQRETNINQSNISRCCLNKDKQSGGYIWKFAK